MQGCGSGTAKTRRNWMNFPGDARKQSEERDWGGAEWRGISRRKTCCTRIEKQGGRADGVFEQATDLIA